MDNRIRIVWELRRFIGSQEELLTLINRYSTKELGLLLTWYLSRKQGINAPFPLKAQ